MSCMTKYPCNNVVQKSDIFVLLVEGRIALLRHYLCEMFLFFFSDPAPIVLRTATKVTMKKHRFINA